MEEIKIGINGFGRMGRLAFRALYGVPGIRIVHVNELHGSAEMSAYLLNFDSVHGTWKKCLVAEGDGFTVEGSKHTIGFSMEKDHTKVSWTADIVVECTGEIKKKSMLEEYLKIGVKKVVVACPVKESGVLNVVLGCNDDLLTDEYDIVTAASCTTNCIAPVIKVIQEKLGIAQGCITTVHNLTNTQAVVDAPNTKKADLRRSRSALMNLAPTSTGSATAIGEIFPELKGKLNGLAIRVPLCNASITDIVLNVHKPTTAKEVNEMLQHAAKTSLKDILGYEEKPLVSTDYINDKRSSIVDALSTMVIDDTMVKIYAWYDNEYGYANRLAELTRMMAKRISASSYVS